LYKLPVLAWAVIVYDMDVGTDWGEEEDVVLVMVVFLPLVWTTAVLELIE
jgi:hypothetical protein